MLKELKFNLRDVNGVHVPVQLKLPVYTSTVRVCKETKTFFAAILHL